MRRRTSAGLMAGGGVRSAGGGPFSPQSVFRLRGSSARPVACSGMRRCFPSSHALRRAACLVFFLPLRLALRRPLFSFLMSVSSRHAGLHTQVSPPPVDVVPSEAAVLSSASEAGGAARRSRAPR